MLRATNATVEDVAIVRDEEAYSNGVLVSFVEGACVVNKKTLGALTPALLSITRGQGHTAKVLLTDSHVSKPPPHLNSARHPLSTNMAVLFMQPNENPGLQPALLRCRVLETPHGPPAWVHVAKATRRDVCTVLYAINGNSGTGDDIGFSGQSDTILENDLKHPGTQDFDGNGPRVLVQFAGMVINAAMHGSGLHIICTMSSVVVMLRSMRPLQCVGN